MSRDADSEAIDKAVGAKFRELRYESGLSQEEIGAAVGVSFQQIQKYERGRNRISASRLFEFATELGCDVADFFDDLEMCEGPIDPDTIRVMSFLATCEAFELATCYQKIRSPILRRQLVALCDAIADLDK